MIYQIVFFQGDVLNLNELLKNMQVNDSCVIVDCIQVTDNNYMIKFNAPTVGSNWFMDLFSFMR